MDPRTAQKVKTLIILCYQNPGDFQSLFHFNAVLLFFSFLPDQWKVVENDQELSVNVSHYNEQDDTIIQSNVVRLLENTRRADKAYHDRYALTVGGDEMASFCPTATRHRHCAAAVAFWCVSLWGVTCVLGLRFFPDQWVVIRKPLRSCWRSS